MADLLTRAYKATVQDRKFLKSVQKSIKKGEVIPKSQIDRFNSMNKVYPRTKNPITNVISWIKTFTDNFQQIDKAMVSRR